MFGFRSLRAAFAAADRLYVANGRSDSVTVIDTAGVAKVAEIAVGQLPWGVVIR